MKYRPEIDGLRAFAVVPVILFHAGFSVFRGGFVGVDVFFVISGYLITSLILEDLEAGRFSFAGFYERRARRILPALLLVIVSSIPFAVLWMMPLELKSFCASIVAACLFVANILFWSQTGYFDDAVGFKPLVHTWSLSVEEQFYLLFPATMLLLWRLGRRNMVAALALAAIASLALSQFLSRAAPSFNFFWLPTRAWELAAGSLCAFIVIRPSARRDDILSSLGLAGIVLAVFAYDKATAFPSVYALLPVVGTCAVILFARQDTFAGTLLSLRPFVAIGLVSYSAYLWHQPLFAFARIRSLTPPAGWVMLLLAAASLALAYLTWRYVERPVRRRGPGPQPRPGAVLAVFALLTSLVAAAGAAGYVFSQPLSGYGLGDAGRRQLAALSIDPEQYVETRFNGLRMKPFDASSNRRKILIIGDSFAQDLVNALYESGLAKDLDLSTRYIAKQCGNLFIPAAQFDGRVTPDYSERCSTELLYDDAELRKLMMAADEVWFASSWQSWQAPLVTQSVENARALTGKTVRVIGRKWLGRVRRRLLTMSPAELAELRFSVPRGYLNANRTMRQSLSPEVFVDVQKLLCGADETTCSPVSQAGDLLTFDGVHLTPQGARYYGAKLRDLLFCMGPDDLKAICRDSAPAAGDGK